MINKTVTRLSAVVLTVGAMAAWGEVTVFGHGAARGAEFDQPTGNIADTTPGCTDCTFGFDAGNELGNGLKAIYRMDWDYDGDTRTSRDRWLGVSGNFGEVKVGTLSTRYKSEGVIPDPMYRASSVNESGVPSVQAGYKAGSNESVDEDGGVGLSYENAGVLIFADHISGKTDHDDTAYKVGAKVTAENFAVFGQYKFNPGEVDSQMPVTSGENTDIWFLGGSLTLGNTAIYAGYGMGDGGVNANVLSGYNSWEVVGVHSVGKFTSIYAGYSGTDCIDKNPEMCDKAGPEGVADDKFSLGIKHNF